MQGLTKRRLEAKFLKVLLGVFAHKYSKSQKYCNLFPFSESFLTELVLLLEFIYVIKVYYWKFVQL